MEGTNFSQAVPAPMMTVKELARLLNVSERTVWENSEPRGTIPALYIGKKTVRYCPVAIQEWMRRQMVNTSSKRLGA